MSCGEAVDAELRAGGQHDHVLDHVLQLPHVARPGVAHQRPAAPRARCPRSACRTSRRPAAGSSGSAAGCPRAARAAAGSWIVTPLMRKYRSSRNCFSATISSRLRLVALISRTSTLDRLVGAEAHDLAVLQHAQELGLHRLRHVADLVQEERAAVGVLEAALAVGRAPVNAPRTWPNSSSSRIVRAEAGAVQRDEPLLAPRGCCCGSRGRSAPCRCRSRP